jgi:hypothetical protein
MDCRKAQLLVEDLAEGRLTDAFARELQRHLADCTDCRVAQQRAARLQQLLSVKRHESPGPEYFDGFLHEFHRRVAIATAPRPKFWEQALAGLRIQNVPTLRYGFAHAFGVMIACGMVLRGLMTTDLAGDLAHADGADLGALHLQAANAVPAPHSQPRRIAVTLPWSTEPVLPASGALSIPVAPQDEPSAPRYVLDRISLSPLSYEVASIHF